MNVRDQKRELVAQLVKLEYGMTDEQIAETRAGRAAYFMPDECKIEDPDELETAWGKWNYLMGMLMPRPDETVDDPVVPTKAPIKVGDKVRVAPL